MYSCICVVSFSLFFENNIHIWLDGSGRCAVRFTRHSKRRGAHVLLWWISKQSRRRYFATDCSTATGTPAGRFWRHPQCTASSVSVWGQQLHWCTSVWRHLLITQHRSEDPDFAYLFDRDIGHHFNIQHDSWFYLSYIPCWWWWSSRWWRTLFVDMRFV